MHHTANSKQIIAQRDSSAGLRYMHGDHLGSVAVTSDGSGGSLQRQFFDPWGRVRSGSTPGVTPNFTGQRLDDTGLLFYNARYYDPILGRFISADPLVPNGERGDLADVTHKSLTVSFIDSRFLNAYNEENQLPAWHLMSESQRADAKEPWGPANAQVLNRYSYVENNPFGYRDPTGHRRIGPACMCPGGGAGRGMGGRWPQIVRSPDRGGGGGSRVRSDHSQERAAQGRRTEPAFRDAAKASQSRVAYDTDTGRYIVRGPDGRYHVFETNGTHVTTVDYTAKTWQARHASGR